MLLRAEARMDRQPARLGSLRPLRPMSALPA
jgi:hypothetical protein